MKPVALFHRRVFRLQQAKQHLQLRKSVSSRLSTWLDLMTVKTRKNCMWGEGRRERHARTLHERADSRNDFLFPPRSSFSFHFIFAVFFFGFDSMISDIHFFFVLFVLVLGPSWAWNRTYATASSRECTAHQVRKGESKRSRYTHCVSRLCLYKTQ